MQGLEILRVAHAAIDKVEFRVELNVFRGVSEILCLGP
jgi:hypothetical protein